MQDDQNLREALLDTMQSLHGRGWCDGTGGNFSVVRQQLPLQLLMAPSGVDKGRVREDELIAVDEHGHVIEGKGRASAETAIHLGIIKSLKAGAVLHTHSLTATVLSRWHSTAGCIQLEGWEMLKGLRGITSHEATHTLPVVNNSQNMGELMETIQPHLQNQTWGLLVAGHGLYAWGDNLNEARRHVEILEFLLSAHWMYQQCSTSLRPIAP